MATEPAVPVVPELPGKPTIEVKTDTTVTIRPPRPANWRTLVVVGGLHSTLLMWMSYEALGWKWGLVALVFAVFEAWTIANSIADDMVSDAFWLFSQRPISVMIVIGSYFYALGQGWLGHPECVLKGTMFGTLFGHFYFTRDNRAFLTSVSAMFQDRREVAR